MKNISAQRGGGRGRPMVFWLLCGLAGLSAAHAQTGTIKGTVDAPSTGGSLSGAKVVAIERKSDKVAERKPVENGQYEIAMPPGSYEVFACDSHLEYEPYSRDVTLKAGSTQIKDFHLAKKTIKIPAKDEQGKLLGPNVAVCLRHVESTCAAEITTDNKGEIAIPGPETHFELHERGERQCE